MSQLESRVDYRSTKFCTWLTLLGTTSLAAPADLSLSLYSPSFVPTPGSRVYLKLIVLLCSPLSSSLFFFLVPFKVLIQSVLLCKEGLYPVTP